MDTLQAFKSVEQYPKDIVPGQIYVDVKRNAVLIPNSPTTFIPFHVSTIKSVSDTGQGQWTFLRINFHTGPTTAMQYPPLDDVNSIWVKELTMKTKSSAANNRLSVASQQIKECLKALKTLETESEVKAAQGEKELEALVLLKSARKEQLENLVIRPNLVGKKTLSNLEIH
jgi:nucleosome binding factor SPN SPT16 subunit